MECLVASTGKDATKIKEIFFSSSSSFAGPLSLYGLRLPARARAHLFPSRNCGFFPVPKSLRGYSIGVSMNIRKIKEKNHLVFSRSISRYKVTRRRVNQYNGHFGFAFGCYGDSLVVFDDVLNY